VRVLVDCDGVLADFVLRVVEFVNHHTAGATRADFGRDAVPYTHDHVTGWDCFAALGAEHLQGAFDAHASRPGFCRGLPVLKGAEQFVEAIRDLGCELVIVTTPYEAAQLWTHERIAWLRSHFEIEKRDVVFCKRKELVRGEVLIDDALHNAESFAEAGGRVLLLDSPWNQTDKPLPEGVTRCHGYSEVIAEIMGLGLADAATDPLPPPRWDDPVPFSCTSLADALPRVSEKSPSIVNIEFGRIDE